MQKTNPGIKGAAETVDLPYLKVWVQVCRAVNRVTTENCVAKLSEMRKTSDNPTGQFTIRYYQDYISPALARYLFGMAKPVSGVDGLSEIGSGGGLETPASLLFLTELFRRLKPSLSKILNQRTLDRKFIDERVRACFEFNRRLGRDILDEDYKTVIGLADSSGRVVIGPAGSHYCSRGGKPVAAIPKYLKGPHVTLFGPPDSARMAINAMNAWHRKLKGEPAIVEELLASCTATPKWGADDEDSKTPVRKDLVDAAVNLTGCFNRDLEFRDGDRHYKLASDHLSAPIKRFPGLALPCTFLFLDGDPVPLHLYDFAIHIWANWHNPEALCFYVPKLENEEEAAYIYEMIATAEAMVADMHPTYKLGTVRLMIVLENPRAILRAHEIIDALYPYFAGASLGWHDYLASTARLFKEDGNYRIPVKADPDIVIKYIKASHSLLADVVGSRGGIKVGGMYGILPMQAELASPSFQVTLKGFFKDAITQMKRDLSGFWVAHPDFMRLGIALVEAWDQYARGNRKPLERLVEGIFLSVDHRKEVMDFIIGPDVEGLDSAHPNYVRSLLVADIKESDFIANNHPDEIRYNVFQSLQYLTDWLCGNGCVALPTTVGGLAVRVMDDLATAERSRWEVWHEIRHGRFSLDDFLRIAHEEMRFIRKDLSDGKKIVQVKYDERTVKWYPVAFRLVILLMTGENPVEFAPELLLPFTVDSIRESEDPWSAVCKIDPVKYEASKYVERWNQIFSCIGCARLATQMAKLPVFDLTYLEREIRSLPLEEIIEAAGFHGDIGETPRGLDHLAKSEQKLVSEADAVTLEHLKKLGADYQQRHGFKFLVPASGKSALDLLSILRERIRNSTDIEMQKAREALWLIASKRLRQHPVDNVLDEIAKLLVKHGVTGVQIAVGDSHGNGDICLGNLEPGNAPVYPDSLFQIASLSKTVATAFAMEYFAARGISMDTPVNDLLVKVGGDFRLVSPGNSAWAGAVTITNLMSHSALDMHYVKGFERSRQMPEVASLLETPDSYGYSHVKVVSSPGSVFQYSGGGFMVLQYLIEKLEAQPAGQMTRPFLDGLCLREITFDPDPDLTAGGSGFAAGVMDDGEVLSGGRLNFPAFAAGALGSARGVLAFLRNLEMAYHDLDGSNGISHNTAVTMMKGRDLGARQFMGCDMGVGVFVAEMGANRVAVHQGANEGFRALYLHTVAGPDRGKGFVILCNADNRGVPFVAEAAALLLQHLDVTGVNFAKIGGVFDSLGVQQEQIVNAGYKGLLFSAFEPTMPEPVPRRLQDALDPLREYNLLSCARILRCSNQRFARAENLFSPYMPVFDPDLYGPQGKVMDSWESVRHNDAPPDFLELQLARPGVPRYVRLSTDFHDGNHAPFVRILGRSLGAGTQNFQGWQEIVPRIQMDGHSERLIQLSAPFGAGLEYSEVRIEMEPDGGLTRVGLYESVPVGWKEQFQLLERSVCRRHQNPIPKSRKPLTIPYNAENAEITRNLREAPLIDWASAAFGGEILRASNEHYGPAAQVISPFPPIHMFDGLESARSRNKEHFEEVVIRLGKEIKLGRIVVDFRYFVNNNPRQIQVFSGLDGGWQAITKVVSVKAFAGNVMQLDIPAGPLVRDLMIRTLPDGGINRIHVFEAT